MSDIRIPPDSVGLRGTSSVTATAAAIVVNPNENISKLPNGQTVAGQVVGRNKNGQLEVMTKLGLMQIQTPQNIAVGKDVLITIQQSGTAPQILMQLVVKNTDDKKTRASEFAENAKAGQTLMQPDAPSAPVAAPSLISGGNSRGVLLPLPGQQSQAKDPDIILTGTVTASKDGKIQVQTEFGSFELDSDRPISAGSPIQIGVFRNPNSKPVVIQPDRGTTVSDKTASVPLNTNPTISRANLSYQAASAAYAHHAQHPADTAYRALGASAGNTVAKPVMIRIFPQGTPAANPIPQQGGQIVEAEVSFISEQSLPTLKTPMGMVRLQTPYQTQIGEIVLIEILPAAPDEATNNVPTTNSGKASSGTPRDLPHLTAIMDYFHKSGNITNSMAQSFFQSSIPNINGKFVNAVMLYLAAISVGESKFWLGLKNGKQLEKDNPQLAAGLQDDFESIARGNDVETANPWRHVPIPIFDGYKHDYVNFYFKNNAQDDDQNYGQRFIIEANLSKLGHMQFDGFVRQNHFDLVMRGDKTLPETLQQDIRRIFQDYMDISGWDGQIRFQTTPQFPVDPARENAAQLHTIAKA